MNITERIKKLTRKPLSAHDITVDQLLPKEVFRKIIDRERDRANRTGEIFSLVVYLLPDVDKNSETLHLLADTLSSSMRSIDAAGWLDSQHLGVLLPETDLTGAQRFAKKINHESMSLKFLANYEVLSYPSEALINPENTSHSDGVAHSKAHTFLWDEWHIPHAQRNVDYMFCLTKRLFKRCFDFIGASVCLLLLSPFFLCVAIYIKVVSPGPIFFKQQRIGYGGHPFTFLKFRTMRQGADSSEHQAYLATLINGDSDKKDADKPMVKLDHDPQIIPGGNLLRKSCLDELPQLFNVLLGEMSLVGPRPPIPYEVKEYHSWHRGRFNALPGMTGLWQVSGKNRLTFREMVRLDIRYAKERSLWLDVKILFRTPLAILEQLKGGSGNDGSTVNQGI